MTNKDILNKAKFIQFPYNNSMYIKRYDNLNINIHKLPYFKDKEYLYKKMDKNGHHYTTEYHRNYVLPLLNELFNFQYNINDFKLIETITDKGDLTYLRPKKDYNYKILCFTTKEIYEGKYEILLNPDFFNNHNLTYRLLYRFPHMCSRIINLDINNNKKIFISGDSQMVPTIPVLSTYYKEVWYFDNRTGWKYNLTSNNNEMIFNKIKPFSQFYKNTNFDDVLIELYANDFSWYTDINLR